MNKHVSDQTVVSFSQNYLEQLLNNRTTVLSIKIVKYASGKFGYEVTAPTVTEAEELCNSCEVLCKKFESNS